MTDNPKDTEDTSQRDTEQKKVVSRPRLIQT